MHPNEHRNGYWLSTKWVLASDQSSVESWLVQPIKELPSAAGLCAGRGCALIRQLATKHSTDIIAYMEIPCRVPQWALPFSSHWFVRTSDAWWRLSGSATANSLAENTWTRNRGTPCHPSDFALYNHQSTSLSSSICAHYKQKQQELRCCRDGCTMLYKSNFYRAACNADAV